MRGFCAALALLADCRRREARSAKLSVAPDHAGGAVPAGRLDRRRRPDHGRADARAARAIGGDRECRRRRRQHRGRPRRARGAGRLHLRHRPVGHPCRQHHLQARLRSRKGLRADRADLQQSAAAGRQERPAGQYACRTRDLDEGQSRQDQFRQPERGGQCHRRAVREPHQAEGAVHSLSRRRPGDDRSDLRARWICWWCRARWRCRRSAPARSRRSPICRRSARPRCRTFRPRTRPACPDFTCRAGSASGRRRARRRTSSPSSMPRPSRRWPIRRSRSASPSLALDVAPRAQQTPEGLAAFQKAEIDKWWPIIKVGRHRRAGAIGR